MNPWRSLLLLPALAAPLQAQDTPQGSLAYVVERHAVQVRVEADGTSRQETSLRVRIESPLGVRFFGQLRLPYNAVNETLDLTTVRVRKADGSVVEVNLATVQDLTGEVARDAPMYSDAREKALPVPSLAPHDTLEFSYVRRVIAPLAKKQFWFTQDFDANGPVLEESLLLDYPHDMTLHLKVAPVFTTDFTDRGGRTIRQWRFQQADDSVLLARERDASTPVTIQVTSFASWDAVAAWYGALERERVVPDESVRRKAAELIRGRAAPAEQLAAIYDFVATEIRYVSLSFGIGRFQPHSASEVLTNRYGDCKDKHTLLAALLSAAGFTSHAALARLDGEVDRDVPSPAQFDHVITAVEQGDSLLWLDVTPEIAPFGVLLPELRGKAALVVRSTDAGLRNTPSRSPVGDRTELTVTGRLEGPRLEVVVHSAVRGDAELFLRRLVRLTPPSTWQSGGAGLARPYGFDKSIEVRDVKFADPLKTREPFFFDFTVRQPDFVPQGSLTRSFKLPLPRVPLPDESAGAEVGGRPSGWRDGVEAIMRFTLGLPAGTTVRLPVGVDVVRDWAEYHSTYRVTHDTLFAERRFRTVERTVPSLDEPGYTAFLRALHGDQAQLVELKLPAGAGTDTASGDVAQLARDGYDALQARDLRRAVTLLGRATRLDPRHQSAWNNLGLAYLDLGRLDSAEAAFRRQVELNPYDEYAWNNIGRVFWRRGEMDSAAAAYRRQIEVSPLDKWAHANLGSLLLDQRKYAEAASALERAVTIVPDDASLLIKLGEAYLGVDQTEVAVGHFKRAVEIAPTPETWNNVGYALAVHGAELPLAREYATAAVGGVIAILRTIDLGRLTAEDYFRASTLAAYWDTLGWVCFQQGDLAAARRFLLAAWQLSPRAVIGDHLGQAQERAGDAAAAIRTLARVAGMPDAPLETRARLVRLAGGDAGAQRAISRASADLIAAREVKLATTTAKPAAGDAEFMLLVNEAGKVEASRYWSGDRKLEPLAAALSKAVLPFTFPADAPIRVPVLVSASCPARGECDVFLSATDRLVTSSP